MTLIPREDVVKAVHRAQLHIYAIGTVDEGLELLSGRPAGKQGPDGRFPEGSFNAAVARALAESAERLRQLRASVGGPGEERSEP